MYVQPAKTLTFTVWCSPRLYFTDGFDELYGENVIFAGPATGEKGYLDVRVEVTTPGGHSSVPPPHTVCLVLRPIFFASTN